MSENLRIVIKERCESVLERIARNAHQVGRDPAEIRLMVVTKGQPLEVVEAVIAAGARCLGENYAEQAIPKITALSGQGVDWHMIGHVQSRKAEIVAEYFPWVHSLDSLKLANRLNRYAAEAGKTLSVLMECNVSGEEAKFGWPAWDETRWPELAEGWLPILDFPALRVRGLMTMPPLGSDPEAARPFFIKLRRLRDFMADRFPKQDWSELSMGMSGDFEVAVQEGATFVRVGTAIVDPRK